MWNVERRGGGETAKTTAEQTDGRWMASQDPWIDPEDLRTGRIPPPSFEKLPEHEREDAGLAVVPQKIPRAGHTFGGQSFPNRSRLNPPEKNNSLDGRTDGAVERTSSRSLWHLMWNTVQIADWGGHLERTLGPRRPPRGPRPPGGRREGRSGLAGWREGPLYIVHRPLARPALVWGAAPKEKKTKHAMVRILATPGVAPGGGGTLNGRCTELKGGGSTSFSLRDRIFTLASVLGGASVHERPSILNLIQWSRCLGPRELARQTLERGLIGAPGGPEKRRRRRRRHRSTAGRIFS